VRRAVGGGKVRDRPKGREERVRGGRGRWGRKEEGCGDGGKRRKCKRKELEGKERGGEVRSQEGSCNMMIQQGPGEKREGGIERRRTG